MATDDKRIDDDGIIGPTPAFNQLALDKVFLWERGERDKVDIVQELEKAAQEQYEKGKMGNAARAYHLIGYVYNMTGQGDLSLEAYRKSRRLFKQNNNQYWLALLDLNEGEHFRRRGEIWRARPLYQRAFANAQSIGHLYIQVMAILNEGLALLQADDLAGAQSSLQWALEHAQKLDEQPRRVSGLLSEIYYGLANVNVAHKNMPIAYEHAMLALEHAQKAESRHSLGLAAVIMGDVLTSLQNQATPDAPAQEQADSSNQPDTYYEMAIDAFNEINSESDLARAYFARGRSLIKRQEPQKANHDFRQAVAIFARLGLQEEAAAALEAQQRLSPSDTDDNRRTMI